jgi:hypothetical protein
LGAGWRGPISIWMSSGAVAMGCNYCIENRSSLFALRLSPEAIGS